MLDALYDRLQFDPPTAQEAIQIWDDAKCRIRKSIVQCKRTSPRKCKKIYSQKLSRLCNQQRAAIAAESAVEDDIEAITTRIEALDIQSTSVGTRLETIRAAIVGLQGERGHMKMAARFRQHTWHVKRTTSRLFESTSLKYADNYIPKIVPAPGAPRQALALLLAFQKAYDSLEREYLIRSLVAHRYHAQFITVVKALRTGTRLRFLVLVECFQSYNTVNPCWRSLYWEITLISDEGMYSTSSNCDFTVAAPTSMQRSIVPIPSGAIA
ncbi:Reverse transcriptase precursor [Phytophthora megakarya]|uniref:Reverse transcriptase n=1 Tax=Phytophthora megakarya TaxID=4795 RepID=A0A225WPT2_9STRA|nr:Reverse transcriptase precursor [Phytophthora megakarya]